MEDGGVKYVQEVELPNGHKWRQRADGGWCRFSKKTCFPKGKTGGDKVRKKWELTTEGSDQVKSNTRFGTFYKRNSESTWWSKDIDGHGESAFKVFKEGKKGLEWIADADEYGNYITGKHKGDTGKFISWDSLKTAK